MILLLNTPFKNHFPVTFTITLFMESIICSPCGEIFPSKWQKMNIVSQTESVVLLCIGHG